MAYHVEFAARAVRDLEVLYLEKNVAESRAAARWFNQLELAVNSLASHPFRCPVAPEARGAKRKLRNLLYGKSPHVYRIIYDVDDDRKIVWVLTIRHTARRKVKAHDLAQGLGTKILTPDS